MLFISDGSLHRLGYSRTVYQNKGFEKVSNSLMPFVPKKIESHYTRCDGTFSFLPIQRFIRTYGDESQKLTHLF